MPFPPPRDLLDPRIKPVLAGTFFFFFLLLCHLGSHILGVLSWIKYTAGVSPISLSHVGPDTGNAIPAPLVVLLWSSVRTSPYRLSSQGGRQPGAPSREPPQV